MTSQKPSVGVAALKDMPQVSVELKSLDGDRDRHIRLSFPAESSIIGRASKTSISQMRAADGNAWIESPVISRLHAELMMGRSKEKPLYLVDTDSTHGTFVNDTKLTPRVSHPLKNGDTINFGQAISTPSATFAAKSFTVQFEADGFHKPSTSRANLDNTLDKGLPKEATDGFCVPIASDSEDEAATTYEARQPSLELLSSRPAPNAEVIFVSEGKSRPAVSVKTPTISRPPSSTESIIRSPSRAQNKQSGGMSKAEYLALVADQSDHSDEPPEEIPIMTEPRSRVESLDSSLRARLNKPSNNSSMNKQAFARLISDLRSSGEKHGERSGSPQSHVDFVNRGSSVERNSDETESESDQEILSSCDSVDYDKEDDSVSSSPSSESRPRSPSASTDSAASVPSPDDVSESDSASESSSDDSLSALFSIKTDSKEQSKPSQAQEGTTHQEHSVYPSPPKSASFPTNDYMYFAPPRNPAPTFASTAPPLGLHLPAPYPEPSYTFLPPAPHGTVPTYKSTLPSISSFPRPGQSPLPSTDPAPAATYAASVNELSNRSRYTDGPFRRFPGSEEACASAAPTSRHGSLEHYSRMGMKPMTYGGQDRESDDNQLRTTRVRISEMMNQNPLPIMRQSAPANGVPFDPFVSFNSQVRKAMRQPAFTRPSKDEEAAKPSAGHSGEPARGLKRKVDETDELGDATHTKPSSKDALDALITTTQDADRRVEHALRSLSNEASALSKSTAKIFEDAQPRETSPAMATGDGREPQIAATRQSRSLSPEVTNEPLDTTISVPTPADPNVESPTQVPAAQLTSSPASSQIHSSQAPTSQATTTREPATNQPISQTTSDRLPNGEPQPKRMRQTVTARFLPTASCRERAHTRIAMLREQRFKVRAARRAPLKTFISGCIFGAVTFGAAAAALLATVPESVVQEAATMF